MSGSVNKVILVGNLTRDPEIRSTQSGDKIVNMTVATSEQWKDRQSGERRERSEFHRVVVFNEHLAKVAEKYLRKGSHVYIEGQLQTRKWSKDGTDHYSTEIVLQRFRGEITMLGSKDRGYVGDPKPDSADDYSRAKSGGAPPPAGGPDDLDSDIPF